MDFSEGDEVVLLPPFGRHFPGVHIVAITSAADDGQPIIFLADIESAFSPVFLRRAE